MPKKMTLRDEPKTFIRDRLVGAQANVDPYKQQRKLEEARELNRQVSDATLALLRKYADRPRVVLARFEGPSLRREPGQRPERVCVLPERYPCDEILICGVTYDAGWLGMNLHLDVGCWPRPVGALEIAHVPSRQSWHLTIQVPDDGLIREVGRIEVLGWWLDEEDFRVPPPRCSSPGPCRHAHRGDLVGEMRRPPSPER